jgi:aryl-alcohol dehydrogenase-like predicted oxidoreductase
MLASGAMELRGAPRGREVTAAQAETILHAALDAGINYIDTSIDYGLSEERIGATLRTGVPSTTWRASAAVWSARPLPHEASGTRTSSRSPISLRVSNRASSA